MSDSAYYSPEANLEEDAEEGLLAFERMIVPANVVKLPFKTDPPIESRVYLVLASTVSPLLCRNA